MGGSGKKKTTMAKLQRENRLAEKRQQKNARKAARQNGLAPTPAAGAEDAGEPDEQAWQLTRGLDRGDLS